jgi:hypothetical protein
MLSSERYRSRTASFRTAAAGASSPALNAIGAFAWLSCTTARSCVGGVARLVGRVIAARVARLQRLRKLLNGDAARQNPRPGRALDRRRELTISLRRAMIRQREDLLDGLNHQ